MRWNDEAPLEERGGPAARGPPPVTAVVAPCAGGQTKARSLSRKPGIRVLRCEKPGHRRAATCGAPAPDDALTGATMGETRKFTILHSNDMHGDFLAEQAAGGGELIGGLPLLSGYINKVRAEEENVLYVIAGDMVQGSIIDSDFKGTSTMQIMNYLAPDVVALGNHEVDYGLPHLLFLEKIANFPIVNANLYIKPFEKRMMRPYHIISKAGFDILFTGILTEKTMDSIKLDELIGTFVTLEEAGAEVGKICDAFKNDDIDLTIVLTHIGFESDKELAAMLRPEWGVDLIIGGHSHTMLSEPAQVNGILIAQAGTGTNQIGRFDIVVDDDTNSIVEWKWQLIPIDEHIAEPDLRMAEFIESFKTVVDRKYSVIITKFAEKLTHPLPRGRDRPGQPAGRRHRRDHPGRRGAAGRRLGAGEGAGPGRQSHGLHGLLPLRRFAHPLHGERRGAQEGVRSLDAARRTGTARASATR